MRDNTTQILILYLKSSKKEDKQSAYTIDKINACDDEVTWAVQMRQ